MRHPLIARIEIAGHDGFSKENPSILCLEYIHWAMRHGRNASVRRLDHPPVVCTPVFDPVITAHDKGGLQRDGGSPYPFFHIFNVSFPTGQHIVMT